MGPVRTPGSASASRLDMANLPYRANGNESADAIDDAHKPVTAISRTFIVVCVDAESSLYRRPLYDDSRLPRAQINCNDLWVLGTTQRMY